eukprot:6456996-Amphidinium_carterae.1
MKECFIAENVSLQTAYITDGAALHVSIFDLFHKAKIATGLTTVKDFAKQSYTERLRQTCRCAGAEQTDAQKGGKGGGKQHKRKLVRTETNESVPSPLKATKKSADAPPPPPKGNSKVRIGRTPVSSSRKADEINTLSTILQRSDFLLNTNTVFRLHFKQPPSVVLARAANVH